MSTEKQPLTRILRKTKEGVTLKLPNGKVGEMSWEQFNKDFVMESDKIHARFSKSFMESAEKVNSEIADAAAATIMMNAAEREGNSRGKITYMLMVGHHVEEIQKLTGCSLLEATQMVRRALSELYGPGGLPFNKKETPEEYRARKKRQEEERDPHRCYKPAATQTLGDNPTLQKLRESMMKEEAKK